MLSFIVINLFEIMQSSQAHNSILTVGEVADYLKITEGPIKRLPGAKKIPSFKVGGCRRFSRADIDGWIREKSSRADKENQD